MSKEENIEKVKGKVIEALPNATFRLELDNGKTIIGYMAGKMRRARVRIIVGDIVEVILDPYGGKATNRIVWRI